MSSDNQSNNLIPGSTPQGSPSPPTTYVPRRGLPNTTIADGMFNSEAIEPIPAYRSTSAEKVIQKGNAFIILGKDRVSDVVSGYGGKGDTDSGAIDLVVGLGGQYVSTTKEISRQFGAGKQIGDTARIYISARADIDDYLGLPTGGDGAEGNRSIAKSAVAIEADDIRLHARRGIKLVTKNAHTADSSMNGQKIKNVIYGIDLIAGGLEQKDPASGISYLQPIPKGENLKICLERIVQSVADSEILAIQLANILAKTISAIVNTPILTNVPTPAGPIPTLGFFSAGIEVSELDFQNAILDMVSEHMQNSKLKLEAIVNDYLSDSGTYHILSEHNRTN